MKNTVVVLVMLVMILSGCGVNNKLSAESDSGAAEKTAYRRMSAKEAYTLMEQTADYIILDVRTEEEFMDIRIPDAILIPDYDIIAMAEKTLTDKEALIFVYCRTGRRSAAAALVLVDLGYKNIIDIGGITDWPYETTGR